MSERARSDVRGGKRGGSAARLFCALDPPEELVERIVAWQRGQGARSESLRGVRPEAMHLTLAFLGERPEGEIPAIAAAIEEAPRTAIEGILRPEPVAVPARRPRLLALEVESSGAERLQADLGRRLREIGVYGAERRPFWPHLTVFRLRGRAPRRAVRAAIRSVEPLADGDGHAFGFVRLALYRSQLGPQRSTYSRLAAAELPQPGGLQKR